MRGRRAVFLDRDGVINELVCFPELGIIDAPLNPKQFKLSAGATEAIRALNRLALKVIIVSNRPEIAKGKMTKGLFEAIRTKMLKELEKRGAHVDAEYYCFHHPLAKDDEYRRNCECRKPRPGLLLRAARELELDLSRCYMVGDGLTDVKAGRAAGCKTFLIGRMKCDLCRLMDEEGARPDFILPSLLEVVRVIEKEVKGSGDIP